MTTPAHASGNVAVTVTTAGGTSAPVPGGYTYQAPPTATSLSPSSGPTAGGTSVTITGTNFVAGATTVTIGGTTIPAGSVTVNSATSLTVTTPAHASGNVAVTVATAGGMSGAVPGGYTYVAVPTVASIAPTSGTTAGGTTVTITGTGFNGATAVKFGATAAAFTVNSAAQITATSPAGGAGTVDVTVTTPGGTSATGAFDQYTYLTPPTAANDSYTTVGNTDLIIGATLPPTPYVSGGGTLLANDTTSGATNVAITQNPAHGSISSFNTATGALIYSPTAGYTGSDTFKYTVTDATGLTSAPATVSITIGGRVWYVNGAAATNGSGASASPFNTLASASASHQAGDTIFVMSGGSATATAGAIALKANATLWGQGTALPQINSTTIANTGATSKPALAATVTLAGSNAVVSSLDIVSGTNDGLNNSGAITGVVVQNHVKVTTTSGVAVNLANASGTFAFDSISTNGAPRGISLVNMTSGTFTVSGTGAAGTGGSIANSTSSAAGDGSIVINNAASVSLNYMNLGGNNASGIVATDVSDLTVANFSVQNFPVTGAIVRSNTTSATTNGGKFNLHDNTFSGIGGSALQVSMSNGGSWTGHVKANTIGNSAVANSGSANGEGIDVLQYGSGTLTVDVSNNSIYQIKQSYGINAGTQTVAGVLNLTLVSNAVQMIQASSLDAVTVSTNSNGSKVCMNATGNTATAAGVSPTNGWPYNSAGMSVLQNSPGGTSVFQIQGYAGASSDTNAVQTYLQSINTLTGPTPADKSVAQMNPGNGFTAAACPTAP